MFNEIKNKIESSLRRYAASIDRAYKLMDISPVLSERIKEYLLRPGKRVRSCLFVVSYLGYAPRQKPGLYESALAFELLHNFMLIHDDIIDRSALRRGKPAMHTLLDRHLARYTGLKFNGSDLGIVIADVIYAMSIDAFMAIRENRSNKEAALKKFTRAAVFTGSGEFVEMLAGAKPIGRITMEDLYRIYDLKTAHYTFCAPLAIGALLAGAPSREISLLTEYGISLGRAFQINDDILDMCAPEYQTGKSTLTDIKESKKTLLLWHAFRKASRSERRIMQRILDKPKPGIKELEYVRNVVKSSGSIDFCRGQIEQLAASAIAKSSRLNIRPGCLKLLADFPSKILRY